MDDAAHKISGANPNEVITDEAEAMKAPPPAWPFRFKLEEKARVISTQRSGTIVGVAAYTNRATDYLLRHKDKDGDLVEKWFTEDTIVLTP